MPIGIARSDVAGVEPSVPDHLGRLVRGVVIALQHVRAANHDFAPLVDTAIASALHIDDPHLPFVQRHAAAAGALLIAVGQAAGRSEEHTSELQSLMRISYAVFCLKKKNTDTHDTYKTG